MIEDMFCKPEKNKINKIYQYEYVIYIYVCSKCPILLYKHGYISRFRVIVVPYGLKLAGGVIAGRLLFKNI